MKRDKNKVEHSIELLVKNAEKDNQNLMPHIINAIKNRVTLGEISDAFQSVFGKYEPRVSFWFLFFTSDRLLQNYQILKNTIKEQNKDVLQ